MSILFFYKEMHIHYSFDHHEALSLELSKCSVIILSNILLSFFPNEYIYSLFPIPIPRFSSR